MVINNQTSKWKGVRLFLLPIWFLPVYIILILPVVERKFGSIISNTVFVGLFLVCFISSVICLKLRGIESFVDLIIYLITPFLIVGFISLIIYQTIVVFNIGIGNM
jgi:hypothetical protein